MNKLYKFIIFDWDGCLANTMDVLVNAFRAVLLKQGYYLNPGDVVERIFGNWERNLANYGVKNPLQTIVDVEAEMKKRILKVKLNKEVEGVLDKLASKDKKLAIITTSPAELVLPVIKELKIESLFKLILTGEDITKPKPHPMMIVKARDKLGGNVVQSLYVGNSINDIRLGKAAAIDTVIFYPRTNWKYYQKEDLKKENPDFLIEHFKKILDIAK